MFCPGCGHRNEKGAKFCSNCARSLPGAAPAASSRSFGERLEALIGTTRRARLATVGTVAMIAIAIAAFVLLQPDDDVPRDQYTLDAEAICVDAKTGIGAAASSSAGDPGRYAEKIVPIATEWRSSFNSLDVPPDRAGLAAELDISLLNVVIEAGMLARIAREEPQESVATQAGQVDEASANVERAVGDLGLERCTELKIAPGSVG